MNNHYLRDFVNAKLQYRNNKVDIYNEIVTSFKEEVQLEKSIFDNFEKNLNYYVKEKKRLPNVSIENMQIFVSKEENKEINEQLFLKFVKVLKIYDYLKAQIDSCSDSANKDSILNMQNELSNKYESILDLRKEIMDLDSELADKVNYLVDIDKEMAQNIEINVLKHLEKYTPISIQTILKNTKEGLSLVNYINEGANYEK